MNIYNFARTLSIGFALTLACSSSDDGGSSDSGGGTGGMDGNAAGASGSAGDGQGTNGGTGGSDLTAGASGAADPAGGGGSGGSIPVGGASGDAGSGGTDATSGGGGEGGAGGATPGRSAGCGIELPMDVPLRQYVQHDIEVAVDPEWQPEYTSREYHVMLPEGYDPNRAYPLYMWGTGCGATHGNAEGIPMSNQIAQAQTDVIFVFLMQEGGCFQAGSSGTANTPDVPYMTKVLDEMEANYCVDDRKEFLAGWSSGAWLSATMSCALGNRLRGIAMSTGGQQPELMPCTGPTAALFFVGLGDGNNPIEGDTGSRKVYERLLAENGCAATTKPWDPRWPECQIHDGCPDNPVVWCAHNGGHTPDNGTNITSEGHWEFFMNLP